MAIRIPRGISDATLDQIVAALRGFEADHPDSLIELYRYNSVSIRIRIIAPEFAGMSRVARHKMVWQYLDRLPEDVQSDISSLILLEPNERTASLANREFEDPVPSGL